MKDTIYFDRCCSSNFRDDGLSSSVSHSSPQMLPVCNSLAPVMFGINEHGWRKKNESTQKKLVFAGWRNTSNPACEITVWSLTKSRKVSSIDTGTPTLPPAWRIWLKRANCQRAPYNTSSSVVDNMTVTQYNLAVMRQGS